MAEYIDRSAFLKQKRAWYCKNCIRRTNSKGKIVYEIGEAPCRACEIGDVLDDLEDVPAADVLPAVLCRDCKYFSEVMYKGTQFEYGYCDRWADGTLMDPEDFCSRAAKREES